MDATEKKGSRLIDSIVRFQLSGAYPVFFAIFCAVSGLGSKYVYLPVISILAISILFSVFFVKDNRVFLTPVLMIYYSMGTDKSQAFFDSNGNVLAAFDRDGFRGICVLAAVIVVPFVIRFIVDGSFALAFKHKSFLLYGILALDAAILLGGAFSEHWTPKNLFYALILVAGLNFFFIIVSSIIKKADGDIIEYTCHILVITCLMISVQVLFVAINAAAQGELIYFDTAMDRWVIQRLLFYFSWGIPTLIGAITAIGIPAALYLAKNERFPLFYYICAIVFFAISIIVNTRSAMFVGALFLIVGAIIISCCGKNKRINLIFSLILFIVFLFASVAVCVIMKQTGVLEQKLIALARFFRLDMISDRISLYQSGLNDFLGAPLFGVGYEKGSSHTGIMANNFFSNMYHCVIIQMGASSGIVGLAAFIFHIKDILLLCFKRFSLDRLLLLSVPVMILCMSLFDNFFFYLNFQIPYVTFLLLANKHTEMQ